MKDIKIEHSVVSVGAVSYTHLHPPDQQKCMQDHLPPLIKSTVDYVYFVYRDVYKRQPYRLAIPQ